MLNSLSLRNINKNNNSFRLYNRVNQIMNLFKIVARTLPRIIINKRGVMIKTNGFISSFLLGSHALTYSLGSRYVAPFSTSKSSNNQDDNRKLLELSESIILSLIEKADFTSTVEIIQQIALILVSQLFKTNKSQSKKVLLFILKVIDEIEPHLSVNEIQLTTKTLKTLWQHIDEINQTGLIIKVDETYLRFIDKSQGRASYEYVEALLRLIQNCISGDELEKALNYLNKMDSMSQSQHPGINIEAKIQNLINFAIVYLSQGNSEASIKAYKAALALTQQEGESKRLQSYKIAILECLGDIYKDRHKFEQSFISYQQSLDISSSFFENININTIILMYKTATVCYQLQKFDQVVLKCSYIDKSLQKNEDMREEFQTYNEMIALLASAHDQLGNFDQAIHYFQRYVKSAEKSIILQDPHLPQILNHLIDLYLSQKRPQDALKHLKSLSRFYKIQGKQQPREACQARIKSIQASFQASP